MSAWGNFTKREEQQEDDTPAYNYEDEVPTTQVRTVQLDGLVLLKIIKHCTENVPEVVTGQLLGLDVKEKLEVTNCFPGCSDDRNEEEIDEHQLEMMKNLMKVNVDNNTVGWYQSALLGSWLNESVITTQYSYQQNIPNSVVVVYDPIRTRRGRLALKAYRLTNEYMELHAAGDLTSTGFAKHGVDSTGIFEEIPIQVHNSHLVHGFLYELREKKEMSCEFDRLSRASGNFLHKTLGILGSVVDDYEKEQSKFHYMQRLIARQKAKQLEMQSKRVSENEARLHMGQDLLDEDPKSVKISAPPPRLDTFLLCNQLSNYCDQIQSSTSLAFSQLYVSEAMNKAN